MKDRPEQLEITCDQCGRVICVPYAYAGRKGKCPQCQRVLQVPLPEEAPGPVPLLSEDMFEVPAISLKPVISPGPNEATTVATEQMLTALGGRLSAPEDVPQRKLPWVIDIFFYPLSRAGLMMLFLSVGIPFILRCLTKFLYIAMLGFLPAMIVLWFAMILHWSCLFMFILYMNWYVCECIRDSGQGGIRAADTIGTTPGFVQLGTEAFRVVLCVIAVVTPAMLYLGFRHLDHFDAVFWTLLAGGGFVFPMALLAVTMHESMGVLHPWLLFRAIGKTGFLYGLLLPFFIAPCLLTPYVVRLLFTQWVQAYGLLFLTYYLLLIFAHLLGCFYRHTEEKLYWDV